MLGIWTLLSPSYYFITSNVLLVTPIKFFGLLNNFRQEALRGVRMESMRLDKWKKPAVLVMAAWWSIYVIVIFLYGFKYNTPARIVATGAYVISQGFTVFFMYTAVKIIRIVRGTDGVIQTGKRKHFRMGIMIVVASIGLVISFVAVLLMITPVYWKDAEAYVYYFYFLFFSIIYFIFLIYFLYKYFLTNH